jgi:hypothetical protein
VLRRLALWIAFLLVHVVVAVQGYVLPSQPMGDVYNVYEPWSAEVLSGGGVVGITESWVYPQLALVPLLLAWVFAGIGGYTAAWALLVAIADALVFALLLGDGRSRGRVVAALFWLAAILLLGPVGMYRLEGITAPLAIAGCLWLARRPWVGSILLAAGVWIKVWPAALLAAAFFALRRRWAVVGGAAAVSAAVIGAVLLSGGADHLWGFVSGQTARGLQVEAPVSTAYVWMSVAGVPGASIFYSTEIITFEVTGPGAEAVAAAMNPVLGLLLVATAALGAVKAWRGASYAALFPPLAFALVLVLIVANKVGSPQYISWLFAPVVVGLVLDRRRWYAPATVLLAVAALTQQVYPILYDRLLLAEVGAVVILSLRNALLVVLLVWALVAIVRVRTGVAGMVDTRRRG